jgi:signal transduction histidine kinase
LESVGEPAERPDDFTGGDHMRQLTKLSRAFTASLSLADLLQMAATQAAALIGAKKAVLMLTDDDGLLRVRASHGVESEIVERFQHPADESLVSRLRGMFGSQLANGFVGVPLVTQGRVVGLLATVRDDGEAPSEDDEWVLSALADQLAAPLENARLAKQLERSALLAENVRLFDAEHAARIAAEGAMRDAELARDAAVRADMSKTSFLAAMSHELRTPLNAIAGYVELLEMGLRGPVTPEQIEDLKRIKTSQAHLLRLITDVLDYARLGAGQAPMSLAPVDLNALLSDTEVMIMPQILAKQLDYAFEPCVGKVVVTADSQRVQQIILNLLSNAIKFTRRTGRVRMRCSVANALRGDRNRRLACVRVSDSGVGIPADRIDSIWQPFVQLGRKLSQPGEGVGLGLAISRDLARRLGGELSVTSEMGVGSTFTLTIPLAEPVAAAGTAD